MNVGTPCIVTCPFCGTEKKLLSLCSGNTFGARYWSDNKQVAPMLPKISFVQKCQECGKYYMLSRQKPKYATEGCSFELGTLTYPEMKEAFTQLDNEGFVSVKEESFVRVLLLHTYNDCFYREETVKQPADDDKQLMRDNIHWLIDNWAEDDILKAELHREAGDFQKCIETLGNVNDTDVFRLRIKNKIIHHAEAKDSAVFETTPLLYQS